MDALRFIRERIHRQHAKFLARIKQGMKCMNCETCSIWLAGESPEQCMDVYCADNEDASEGAKNTEQLLQPDFAG
jgi:hypothetical protein